MSISTGVGRGHGRHHHGPRAKKPTAAMSPTTPVSPPVANKPVAKSKGVGRGHGKHHHGPNPKAHHSHKRKVK